MVSAPATTGRTYHGTTQPPATTARTADESGDQLWTLVERAQQGDTEAFGDLYDRTVDVVYRFAFWRLKGDPQHAEDVTADVYLRALRSITTLNRAASSPTAWLLAIARNMIFDWYKSGRRRLEFSGGTMTSDSDHPNSTATQDPADRVAERVDTSDLWRAVKDNTSASQSEVLYWRFVEEYTVAQTAETMGLSGDAVKALQYRTCRKLAKRLAGTTLGQYAAA